MAAGVTDRLWEVSDFVALIEVSERRLESGMTKRYIVYVNDLNNKSVGHLETCPHAKVWGGHTTAAGGWVGPYDSKEEAELAGKMSGKPFHWCGHCSKSK